jgi:hypothetical protein
MENSTPGGPTHHHQSARRWLAAPILSCTVALFVSALTMVGCGGDDSDTAMAPGLASSTASDEAWSLVSTVGAPTGVHEAEVLVVDLTQRDAEPVKLCREVLVHRGGAADQNGCAVLDREADSHDVLGADPAE